MLEISRVHGPGENICIDKCELNSRSEDSMADFIARVDIVMSL